MKYPALSAIAALAVALLLAAPAHAQQFNITPYNTIYSFIIKSPPINSFAEYNPNIFSGGLYVPWYYDMIALYNLTTNSMMPELAENWTFTPLPNGGLNVTIILRKTGWSDGVPVTCWDIYATNLVLGLVSAMFGNVTVVNNRTCIISVPPQGVSPIKSVRDYGLLGWGGIALFVPYHVWKPFIDNLTRYYDLIYIYNFGKPEQRAAAGKNLTSVIQAMFKYRPSSGPSNGPFYLCDINPQYFLLCKNPYYWNAKAIKPQYIVLYQFASITQAFAAAAAGKINLWLGAGIAPSQLPQLLSNPNVKFINIPNMGGDAIYFNFLNPWLRIPEVRRAFYYIAIWSDLAIAAYGPGFILPSPTPQDGVMTLFHPEFQRQMIDYWKSQGYPLITYTVNQTKAAELLQSAGFKKVGQWWYTPNGTQFKLKLYIGSGASAQALSLAQAVANALTAFGIQTEVVVFPGAMYSQVIKEGPYDLWIDRYSNAFRPGIPSLFPESGYLMGYPFNVTHWNGEVTLPNGTKTTLFKMCPEVLTTEQQAFECAALWAWELNHNPWIIQLNEWTYQIVVNDQYINWPPSDSPIWRSIVYGVQQSRPGFMALMTHLQFKPPAVVTTTSAPPPTVTTVVTTTAVTTTTVVSGTTTTVVTTLPVTSTVTTAVAQVPSWVWAIVAVLIVVIIAVAVLALRRR